MIFSINASQSSAPVQLQKGCAMTFRAARPGVLRVTSGRVWATMSPQDTRDLVLTTGSEMAMPARQDVVVEAWPLGDGGVADLVWESAPTNLL
ncbi:MAG: DUF2917 domain-containing protein [Rhodoferax sp.]|nr:DUF2917 domain-containing protein [Rhodoferax sp.]